MAITVEFGSVNDFNALAFAQPTQRTLDYLEERYNNFSNTLTEAGRSFYQAIPQLRESLVGSEALRSAKAALRKTSHMFDRDEIKPMSDIGSLQQARYIMQRWIMAEPTTREMYHNQQCDGYAGQYIDMQPGVIGEDHYDYRRVNNGWVAPDPENADEFKYTIYVDDLHDGDEELSHEDKDVIHSVWSFAKYYGKLGGDDHTSRNNGKL